MINLGISAQAIDFEFGFCKHARCSSTLEIVFSKTYTARTSEENFEGGVHQRSSAASSSVSEPSQPGVHQRLGKPESLDTCEKAPLQHSLGKDWCRGRTPTSSCLKYAKDAKASGAVNLGAMAEGSSKSNRFRKMKRAVGWPPAATPISYIEIPTKSAGPGFLNPHPILCPIDSFERAMADSERRIKYLCNDLREIPTFWDNMENTDLFRTISGNIDREKTFPFFCTRRWRANK